MVDDPHAHSPRCWWDLTQARWVCAPQAVEPQAVEPHAVEPQADAAAVDLVECAEQVARAAESDPSASGLRAAR